MIVSRGTWSHNKPNRALELVPALRTETRARKRQPPMAQKLRAAVVRDWSNETAFP